MSAHSKLPPSKAYQWAVCTASVSFIEANRAILPDDTSKEADEGTRAHALLTARLKHTLGQLADNEEMDALINELVRFIHSLIRPGDTLFVDQRVSLFYLPSEYGTLDVSIYGPDRIVILDLKYGKGVSVTAEKNKQTAIYGESQLRTLELIEEIPDTMPVHLVIWQPRDRSNSQAKREWILPRRELREFCAEIDAKAKVVLSGKGLEFKPGEACKFCRATGICKAYGTHGLVALSDEEVPVDAVLDNPLVQLVSPNLLTRDQRQVILESKATLIAWLEAVENQEVAELLNNGRIVKFKLVEGKSNRAWRNQEAAEKLLLRFAPRAKVKPETAPELVSPAQAEKLLTGVTLSDSDKEELANLIVKPKGKPTLVPVTDNRQALEFDLNANLTNLDADASDLI